jgi:hypothetical protein
VCGPRARIKSGARWAEPEQLCNAVGAWRETQSHKSRTALEGSFRPSIQDEMLPHSGPPEVVQKPVVRGYATSCTDSSW